ncbi:MAG TPA: hypothetical protein VI072_13220, partial [Polyangiaceae bacterium]
GVRVPSILQLRPNPGVRKLTGWVGVNEGTLGGGVAVFRVMDARRRKLWQSPELSVRSAPIEFQVSIEHLEGDVFLCTAGDDASVYADWLAIAALP